MLTKNFQQLQSKVVFHVEADKVAQGSYQTCFIGCLANQADNPDFIQSKYGIPLAVSRIAEAIFENLPAADAPRFFAALPEAIGCDGKDLSRVHWQFLAAELRSLPAMPNGVQAVIYPVIAGMDLLSSGLEWKEAQAWANAAYATADAAANAADAATYATANRANAILRQRDLLLRLIKEAPVA